MKRGACSLFAAFSLLLAFGGCVALITHRLDGTLLSYTYMARELEAAAPLLNDPVIRKESVNGTFNYLRRTFTLDVPVRLDAFALQAAYLGFHDEWHERTGKRLLFNTLSVISRRAESLSLPISIHEFKLALLDIARKEFGVYEYVDIDREVTAMSTTFDLVETAPEESLNRAKRILKLIKPLSVTATYLLPGALMLLIIVTLGIGRGLKAAGTGLIAAGILVTLGALGPWDYAVERITSLTVGMLPDYFSWVGSRMEDLFTRVISGMLLPGIITAVVGLGLFILGFVFINYRRSH